jgi:hypothetical protein
MPVPLTVVTWASRSSAAFNGRWSRYRSPEEGSPCLAAVGGGQAMIDQPVHVVAREQPLLHPLRDGRFQIVRDGALAPILTGYGYVLATPEVIDILRREGVSVPDRAAILYDPSTKTDITGYRQLDVTAVIAPETIATADLAEEMWLYANADLFVAPKLHRPLRERFGDLVFSEGFSDFAG